MSMSSDRSQAVTAADIARTLGVSQTTVSAVLRGQAQQRRISPKTSARVLKAVEKLNYVPNQMARSLRRQRSGMVGVVVGNFSWGWTEAVMHGMLEVFRPSDYTPFVAIHEFDAELARRELLSCLERRDEGIICHPLPGMNEVYARIMRAGVPLVFLGDRPANMPEASFVGWDAGPAARTAVQHLIDTGRKRIAFIGIDYPMEGNLARDEAYRRVLGEAGLPQREHWVAVGPFGAPPEQIVANALDQMFASGVEHPDAIFGVNDTIGVSLLEQLPARGLRVPDDVAVIGLGDLPLSGHSPIDLSTVKEPCEEMGRQAAKLMTSLIQQRCEGPVHCLIQGQDLKVRKTTQRANDGGGAAS